MTTHWVQPQPAPGGALSEDQVESWRTRGFTLVDDLLPAELIGRVQRDANSAFPAAGSPESRRITDFGSDDRLVFPASSDAANELTLHPRLLAAVSRLLGIETRQLRLTQSDLWVKYGREQHSGDDRDNDDQRIHVDYPNHTLTHPPRWDEPEAVEVIVYLCDVDSCGGATAVVPRSGDDDPAYPWPIVATPGVAGFEWINDRASAEAYLEREAPEVARWRAEHLYPRELHARFRTGTALLYRHDTWHRGTPLEPGTMRAVHNLTFRKATSEWISTLHSGWAWAMYRRNQPMERLIARASVDQRCVLGFPAPGHPYWTVETLAAVAARFGPLGMDMAPYEKSLGVDLSRPR
jgi:ectoine hydroxylase-related dioxygenase (phytanoyl-CoA dioxygenase family)